MNRRIGQKRQPGSDDGLTRAQAEKALRRLQQAESSLKPAIGMDTPRPTVDFAVSALRKRLVIEGARTSELAIENGWCAADPVTRAARPRRHADANPDLRFLTVAQLQAVLEAISG